ncbi:hypothetical protein [Streptomyces sp. NPDC024089]|uniref:hypothetical protein n=1 Tax=Streptomyces sp. NPDC024089 TaxID=3154328 RepID=UPI0034094C33
MTPSIAPATPMSSEDVKAHEAASYVRSVPVDSAPDIDKALRRVRGGQARSRRTASALVSAGSW